MSDDLSPDAGANAVVARTQIASESFLLGRLLDTSSVGRVEFERVVPPHGSAVPFYVENEGDALSELRDHDAVRDLVCVGGTEGRTMYSLDWDPEADPLFRFFVDRPATPLRIRGEGETWELEILFRSSGDLRAFTDHCRSNDVRATVSTILDPTFPTDQGDYPLTAVQRETLVSAVEMGYYDVPRRISSADLADDFGISDQALIGRLRRAIVSLVSATIGNETEEA